jgi:flagellar basal-body rod protein FlgB
MNLDSIPLFSMLKSRLGYENQREKLIGQNVANADTPFYSPQDLNAFQLPPGMGDGGGQLQMAQPSAGGGGAGGRLQMAQPGAAESGSMSSMPSKPNSRWKVITSTDSEATLDGNKVVLEDQMAKMSEARMDYDAAIGFYQKSLDMLRLASRRPGQSS